MAGKPTGELMVPQAQVVVTRFFGSFVVIDIQNNLLNCLSSRSSGEGRHDKAGCFSGACFIIYIIGLFCSIQSILQGSRSATSHLICLRERKSLDFVCLTSVIGRNIAIFFCLQQGGVESWVCCVDSWRFFFSIFAVFLHVIYFFFNSNDSYVPCYVLEIQESKASLLLNFVSPRVGLRKWGWCGRNRHQTPMYCFKAQEWCRVRRAVPVTAAVYLRSMFLHICGKKEMPTWNKFPGKNSVLVPRVLAIFFSLCSFNLIWVSSLPLIFWEGCRCCRARSIAPAFAGARHALGQGMWFFPLPRHLAGQCR